MTSLSPFMSCPSFSSCSTNDCPLDPEAALHGGSHRSCPGEEACRAQRKTRERIAVEHGYPAAWGLTAKESSRDARRAAGQARWLALPTEERERRLAGLRQARERRRAPLAAERAGSLILRDLEHRLAEGAISPLPDAVRCSNPVTEAVHGVDSGVLERRAAR